MEPLRIYPDGQEMLPTPSHPPNFYSIFHLLSLADAPLNRISPAQRKHLERALFSTAASSTAHARAPASPIRRQLQSGRLPSRRISLQLIVRMSRARDPPCGWAGPHALQRFRHGGMHAKSQRRLGRCTRLTAALDGMQRNTSITSVRFSESKTARWRVHL